MIKELNAEQTESSFLLQQLVHQTDKPAVKKLSPKKNQSVTLKKSNSKN